VRESSFEKTEYLNKNKKILLSSVPNPFFAPIYRFPETTSTMDEAKRLGVTEAPHGSVIIADHQNAGRGRIPGRRWESSVTENLLFTVILRYRKTTDIPTAFTLRIGVAISLTIKQLAPSLSKLVTIKWPNDVLIDGRKVCGVLVESDSKNVFVGIGLNVAQRIFPEQLADKATSLVMAAERYPSESTGMDTIPDRFSFLSALLAQIQIALSPEYDWHFPLQSCLYKNGKTVQFINGTPDSGHIIEGTLAGIGPLGELIIIPKGQSTALFLVTGELAVYGS